MDAPIPALVLRRIPVSGARSGVNNTWRARVRTADGESEAYIKRVTARELMVECVCAMIGRAMSLPIPRPLLVHNDESLGVLFGADAVAHPDLRHAALPSKILTAHLQQWKQLPLACAFDHF